MLASAAHAVAACGVAGVGGTRVSVIAELGAAALAANVFVARFGGAEVAVVFADDRRAAAFAARADVTLAARIPIVAVRAVFQQRVGTLSGPFSACVGRAGLAVVAAQRA